MTTAAAPNGKKTVPIADDSALNREMLAEILGEGCEYRFAEDGEELLRLLSRGIEADILLPDMHMPKMSGMETLKIMKARRWSSSPPRTTRA